jgi:ubiquinone/menaquinone biosynthesis C-methylase UbiE
MTADALVYRSERLARAYAFHRPAVHAAIWRRIVSAFSPHFGVSAALDIGCGAGASTAVLAQYARRITGVDPSPAMLDRARNALPKADFVLGGAEALPFESEIFELVTAAGSLNYVNVQVALREVSRVLRPGGHFVAFDFSTGRVMSTPAHEAPCFNRFRTSFPSLPGYALDLKALPYGECALELVAYEDFAIQLRMTAEVYVDYLLSETNVEAVIAQGMDQVEARRICSEIFQPLFESESRSVRFASVFAVARKLERSAT